MNDDEKMDHIKKLTECFLKNLEEFEATAQVVLCFKQNDGNTRDYSSGTGLWYARAGMLREVLTVDDERVRIFTRNQSKSDEDGEGSRTP